MSNPFVRKSSDKLKKKLKGKVKSYNRITLDVQKATNALGPLGNERAKGTSGPQPGSPFKKKTNSKKKKISNKTYAYPPYQRKPGGLAT